MLTYILVGLTLSPCRVVLPELPCLPHPEAIKRFIRASASRSATTCARNIRINGMYEILRLTWRESNWNPNCRNPRSTSYGLNGFLNSTWKSVGVKKTSDPHAQLEALYRYVDLRYGGSPARALAFHRKHNYY